MPVLKPLSTTGIGSVPFLDVRSTMDLVARTCPDLPFWPQFVRLNNLEDMVIQSVDGLTFLEVVAAERRVAVRPENRERNLTLFYEKFLERDWDWFAVPDGSAAGLVALLDRAAADPGFGPKFLKVQITGPITLGQSVKTPDGRNLIDDPELADAMVKGLGAKAAWLAGKIRETGRTPIVFLDEPGLTGFGSAFSTLKREEVILMLNEAAEIARSDGPALIGTHVCGNTDWGLLAETTLDIINFDAYEFLDHFALYPLQVRNFLERGGWVAWGVVPTHRFTGRETPALVAEKLTQGWQVLAQRGLDPDLIKARAVLSPACGTGTLAPEQAVAVFELLAQTAEVLHGQA
ncbi:MAG: hypothetical protein V1816_05535 [Pseudomonadota bacterium]